MEMTNVFVSTVINAPIERVWHCVSDFNGLPAWMPGMKDSAIEPGKGEKEIGTVRSLTMIGSKDKLRERLEVLSPKEFMISYSVLEGPLPVKKHQDLDAVAPHYGYVWHFCGVDVGV